MNEAFPGDKAKVPLGPGLPNSWVKAGMDWTPPKLVVSYPKPTLRRAVMTHAVKSGSVIRFTTKAKPAMTVDGGGSRAEKIVASNHE